MIIFERTMLMKAHALLAAFVLPVAIMFFITGAFYTWGVKGSYETSVYDVQLQKPIQDELSVLVALAAKELTKKNIKIPTGQAKVKRTDNSFWLEWSGSNKDIILKSTTNPFVGRLEIKNTSWYRQFVQLHKAKGAIPFKIYAAIFASAMMLLLVSGFMIAWQTPQLRKLTFFSASLGGAVFLVMVLVS